MSILTSARQWPLVAVVEFTQADLTTGVPLAVLDVPQGAVITGGQLIIDTAFDSATSDTIDVGFTTPDDTDDPDHYLAGGADNGSTPQSVALVPTGRAAVGSEQITIENTEVGAAGTAGVGRLIVEYVIEGRHTENYGDEPEFQGAPA